MDRKSYEWDLTKTDFKDVMAQIEPMIKGKKNKKLYIELYENEKIARIVGIFDDDTRFTIDIKYENKQDILDIFKGSILSTEKATMFGVEE